MRTSFRVIVGGVFALAAGGCGLFQRGSASPHAGAGTPGETVIPTVYRGDRFFAMPVTTSGDTVPIFLDTGGGTLVWEPDVGRSGLVPADSIRTSRGYRRTAALPAFRPDRSVPEVAATSLQGKVLLVYPITAGTFGDRISRSTMAQLGQLWFDERVWTLDYLGHQLTLHAAPPAMSARADHRLALDFRTDSLGHRFDHVPRIPVMIDGDSLNMLFDTGATAWLSDQALAQVHDGQPSERAVSLVSPDRLAKWRQRHPDWRFLSKADLATQSDMIEVPKVSIAGYDVGPAWFATTNVDPPTAPRRVRIDGTVGGSVLRYFSVLLDYQRAFAEFRRGSPVRSSRAK